MSVESGPSFRNLLPAVVALAEHVGPIDVDRFPPLYVSENASVQQMVAPRRAEFVAGRSLARRAMHLLGVEPSDVPRRADRAPCWPTHVHGSITHCEGFVAAAVADARAVRAVGIDAERLCRIDPDILRHIGTPSEQMLVCGRDEVAVRLHVAVTFGAKESVQKAWGAKLGIILPFSAVEAEGFFAAQGEGFLKVRDPRLLLANQSDSMRFVWSTYEDFVLVAMVAE